MNGQCDRPGRVLARRNHAGPKVGTNDTSVLRARKAESWRQLGPENDPGVGSRTLHARGACTSGFGPERLSLFPLASEAGCERCAHVASEKPSDFQLNLALLRAATSAWNSVQGTVSDATTRNYPKVATNVTTASHTSKQVVLEAWLQDAGPECRDEAPPHRDVDRAARHDTRAECR